MTCISNGFWHKFFLETVRQEAKELAVLQLCSAAAVWKSAPGFYSGLKFSSFSDFFPSILVGITENSFRPIWNRFPPPPFYFSWPAYEPTNQLLCSSLYYVPYKSIVPTRLFSITPPSFSTHGQMVIESKYLLWIFLQKKQTFTRATIEDEKVNQTRNFHWLQFQTYCIFTDESILDSCFCGDYQPINTILLFFWLVHVSLDNVECKPINHTPLKYC